MTLAGEAATGVTADHDFFFQKYLMPPLEVGPKQEKNSTSWVSSLSVLFCLFALLLFFKLCIGKGKANKEEVIIQSGWLCTLNREALWRPKVNDNPFEFSEGTICQGKESNSAQNKKKMETQIQRPRVLQSIWTGEKTIVLPRGRPSRWHPGLNQQVSPLLHLLPLAFNPVISLYRIH